MDVGSYQNENLNLGDLSDVASFKYSSKSIVTRFLIFVSLIGLAIIASLNHFQPPLSITTLTVKNVQTTYDAEMEIEGASPDYGTLASMDFLPWDAVIEPFRESHLMLSSVIIDGDDVTEDVHSAKSSYSVSWTIYDEEYSGYKINVNIPFVGVLNASVSIHDASLDKVFSQTFTVAVKYVRREIRTLTDNDRQTFLDTLQLLYTTDLADGKEKYGDKFVNAEFLVYRHLNGAGTTDCDHWHDGAGFPMSHTAITLEAEQALQAIDPSMSMPYWEYAQVQRLLQHFISSLAYVL